MVQGVYYRILLAMPLLKPKEHKSFSFIRDHLRYRGKSPSLREIQDHLGFKSPRSAQLIVDALIKKGFVERTPGRNLRLLKNVDEQSDLDRVISLPLVGSVPCGLPLLATENTEMTIPVSQRLAKPGAQYFLLRATGDSMNQAGIDDEDILLVRQQPVADEGERVVALIGDEVTVKEFTRKKGKVVLRPRSSNKDHQPLIMEEDFMIQGVVIDVLPNLSE